MELKKQFRITLFDENLNPTEDCITIDLTRIIRTHLSKRKYVEKSVIEGVQPKEVVKQSLSVTIDEFTSGSEPVPTKFDKDGNVTHAETRKFERYTEIFVLDEKEIVTLLDLITIN